MTLNSVYSHFVLNILATYVDREHDKYLNKGRLIWIHIDLVVCVVYGGDFYTIVDNDPEFRDVVLISGDHPSNGYCFSIVNTTR
jgi:hypothetical protein